MRIRPCCLFLALALLALPTPSEAFLSNVQLQGHDETFFFVVGTNPQWTLSRSPSPRQYRGASADTAKFQGATGLSFSDSTEILLDGAPVFAVLKVKINADCSRARLTLKDRESGEKISITYPNPGDPNAYLFCQGL